MSKKLTSPESSNDEQTKQRSDSVFQQDDNAKSARLTSFSDTTLQDLPIELAECILVKAVAMEVKGISMKLAKSAWKEKAGPVISRLRTVCSQWSSILTTNSFRTKLHRTLDAIAQEPIRLEILHQSWMRLLVSEMTTLKDEIFMLHWRLDDEEPMYVYDRNNLTKEKDVIQLLGIDYNYGISMASCSVSNCVYLLHRHFGHISIFRITKVHEHQFKISPLISNIWMPQCHPTLSITANGSLILSRKENEQLSVVSIYDANGSLQHEIRLSSDISRFMKIIPRSNGNIVLVSPNAEGEPKLTEIDMDGTILRQYQSSLRGVCQADIYGRIMITGCQVDISGHIMITDQMDKYELLDSEFNLLEFSGPQLDEGLHISPDELHYNSEKNEIVAIVQNDNKYFLAIFHITEG